MVLPFLVFEAATADITSQSDQLRIVGLLRWNFERRLGERGGDGKLPFSRFRCAIDADLNNSLLVGQS